jgi:predicted HTH domain antitoxin
MTEVRVALPDSLFAALRLAPAEVARELKIAAAIHWYQQGEISMERAAETAGLSRRRLLEELLRRRVDVFAVSREDLEADVARG